MRVRNEVPGNLSSRNVKFTRGNGGMMRVRKELPGNLSSRNVKFTRGDGGMMRILRFRKSERI